MADHGHDKHDAHDDHGVGHLVPVKYLIANGTALLFLTVITVWVAQFDFGAANIWIALAIAGLKASLVVLFFMHLWWDRAFNAFIFVASIAFVLLFISFALTDSLEYRDQVIPGEGSDVQERLAEITAAES